MWVFDLWEWTETDSPVFKTKDHIDSKTISFCSKLHTASVILSLSLEHSTDSLGKVLSSYEAK